MKIHEAENLRAEEKSTPPTEHLDPYDPHFKCPITGKECFGQTCENHGCEIEDGKLY